MKQVKTAARSSRRALALLGLAVAIGGCYRGQDRYGAGGDDDPNGDEPEGAVDAFCDEQTHPSVTSRFVRLSHHQYDNTVTDLLAVAQPPGDTFIADPAVAGFTNNADQLRVNDPLARDYRRAAEQLATDLLDDLPRLRGLIPCDPSAEGCAREFVAEFGRRAYRRPLDEAEQAQLEAIFASGAGLYATGTDFEQGVAMTVEAILQSPSFLYRSELSEPEGGGDLVALGGYEIANRLSYMLWNTMPDTALFEAAASGELDTAEGIEAHARRMLEDPRAADPIEDFHRQWLGLAEYGNVTKDPERFPEFVPGITDSMEAETLAFAQRVLMEGEGTFTALMTSTETYVAPDLAPIYGVSMTGDEPQWVTVDESTRAGLLTQPGFLASHAYFGSSSPIHRGVFIQRQILCTDIPDPPGDVDLELPPPDGELVTTRDRVEHHTSAEACVGCHRLINEPGYAFEGYDAIGRARTEDNGAPIDSTGSILTTEGMLSFTDGVDLAHQLAQSPTAQRCYLTQWFRYASARQETEADACTLDGLHESLVDSEYDLREMLVGLTQTVAFRYRSAQGEQ